MQCNTTRTEMVLGSLQNTNWNCNWTEEKNQKTLHRDYYDFDIFVALQCKGVDGIVRVSAMKRREKFVSSMQGKQENILSPAVCHILQQKVSGEGKRV